MLGTYIIGWFGLMLLAILNGTVRDFAYKERVGELAAHQISTGTLILLIGVYTALMHHWWPIPSAGEAWLTGCVWLVMTETFEVGMVRFISHKPWNEVVESYNLVKGRLWILIPAWVLVAPWLAWAVM